MSTEETSSATEEKSAGGGGGKIVLILTGVNLLVTVGIVALLFISFQKDKKAQIADIQSEEAPAAEAKGEGHGEGKGEGKGEGHGGGKGEGHASGEAKKAGLQYGKMMTLDLFTVNMSTPGSPNPKFARINMAVEVPNEDVETEVTQKMPQVRNTIIDLINSKRPSDVATAEGRDFIKDEIKNALNSFMVTGKVKNVFFTNFNVSS